MFPEESVQAAIDLKSKLVMPIHWGAFSLAIHDWSDSVERIVKKADELHMPVATPGIGQPLIINNGEIKIQYENWWENFMP
jgi:L-ascorbate metabolism protein UlaG (beta-lactamase superfamily)